MKRKVKTSPAVEITAFLGGWLICWPVAALLLYNFGILQWPKAFVAAGVMYSLIRLCSFAGLKVISVTIFWGALIFGAIHFTINFVTE